MSNIASLAATSNALDTVAKFMRVVEGAGVTSDEFNLPINDLTARKNLAAFFRNGCQLVVKGPSVLVVDRAAPFDPVKFIGSGWSVVEQDERSLALTEIDFSKVRFESGLKEGESVITGEVKLERLKELPEIRLDAKFGQALYEEKGQATLRFLHDTYKVTWMEFTGTVLRGSGGSRCSLFLYRLDDGSWRWDYYWLGYGRFAGCVSPLLAS